MKYRVMAEKIVTGYVEVTASSAAEAYEQADIVNPPYFEPDGDYVEVRVLPSYTDDFSDRVEEVEE